MDTKRVKKHIVLAVLGALVINASYFFFFPFYFFCLICIVVLHNGRAVPGSADLQIQRAQYIIWERTGRAANEKFSAAILYRL